MLNNGIKTNETLKYMLPEIKTKLNYNIYNTLFRFVSYLRGTKSAKNTDIIKTHLSLYVT